MPISQTLICTQSTSVIGVIKDSLFLQAFPCEILKVDWKADKLSGMILKP